VPQRRREDQGGRTPLNKKAEPPTAGKSSEQPSELEWDVSLPSPHVQLLVSMPWTM
jgi:hypothetical protein